MIVSVEAGVHMLVQEFSELKNHLILHGLNRKDVSISTKEDTKCISFGPLPPIEASFNLSGPSFGNLRFRES